MTIAPEDKVAFKLKVTKATLDDYISQFDTKVIREEIRPEYPVPVKIIEPRRCEGCLCQQIIGARS